MAYRTVVVSTYDEYLKSEYPETACDTTRSRDAAIEERQARLVAFPYTVVLQVAFPEGDFANRWCWQQFGRSMATAMRRRASTRRVNFVPRIIIRECGEHIGWRRSTTTSVSMNGASPIFETEIVSSSSSRRLAGVKTTRNERWRSSRTR